MHSPSVDIKLMQVVSGTSTNADGFSLFLAIDQAMVAGANVRLSLLDATAFSSSFLNSSIGAVIEKHGFESFRKSVALTNCTASQLKKLRAYVADLVAVA